MASRRMFHLDALIREGFLIIFPSGVILVNNHPPAMRVDDYLLPLSD